MREISEHADFNLSKRLVECKTTQQSFVQAVHVFGMLLIPATPNFTLNDLIKGARST